MPRHGLWCHTELQRACSHPFLKSVEYNATLSPAYDHYLEDKTRKEMQWLVDGRDKHNRTTSLMLLPHKHAVVPVTHR